LSLTDSEDRPPAISVRSLMSRGLRSWAPPPAVGTGRWATVSGHRRAMVPPAA